MTDSNPAASEPTSHGGHGPFRRDSAPLGSASRDSASRDDLGSAGSAGSAGGGGDAGRGVVRVLGVAPDGEDVSVVGPPPIGRPSAAAVAPVVPAAPAKASHSGQRIARTRLWAANLLRGWADRVAGRSPGGSGARTGAGGGRPRWSRRRKGVVAAVGVCVVVLVAALLAGTFGSSGEASYSVAPAAPEVGPAGPLPTGGMARPDATSGSDAGRSSSVLPPGVPGVPGVPGESAYAPEKPGEVARPAGVDPRIVRSGSASLEVRAGGVDAATHTLTETVTGLGGYVEASELSGTASTTDDQAQFASVTLRVPADSFDKLLGGLGEVGTVLSSTTSSQDVTGDYVDLEARIRALETSRSTYLTLLTHADTVGDTLAVQQQIDGVQIQLEQIEGQRQVLADASDLATLTVQVSEEGAPTTQPEPEPSGIGAAFEKSWDRFVSGLESVIAAIGPIVLVLLLLGLAYGALRVGAAIYRRRRPVPTEAPAVSAPAVPPAQPQPQAQASAAAPQAAAPQAPAPQAPATPASTAPSAAQPTSTPAASTPPVPSPSSDPSHPAA